MWLVILKLQRRAVVVPPLPFSLLWLILLIALSGQSRAEPEKFFAQLHAHTPQELDALLSRAESWAQSNSSYPDQAVTIILHGPEANAFVKANYAQYQTLVDKAARLDAFNVVDIKICETWMGANMIMRNQLPAFVDTVPLGSQEEERLIKSGYQQF